MQRRTILAAMAFAVSLTGCQGPENLTSPNPSYDYVAPPTIVQDSHVTPSGNTDENQYGGARTDVPDSEDDDTCETD